MTAGQADKNNDNRPFKAQVEIRHFVKTIFSRKYGLSTFLLFLEIRNYYFCPTKAFDFTYKILLNSELSNQFTIIFVNNYNSVTVLFRGHVSSIDSDNIFATATILLLVTSYIYSQSSKTYKRKENTPLSSSNNIT